MTLHAELHGKLSPDSSELERSEDVLTSAVLGTLLLTRDLGCLRDWLATARPHDGSPPLAVGDGELHYWFWPRLIGVEPDVVLRIGDALIAIEVKYLSGASGDDQLARQWNALQPDHPHLGHYPPDLRAAVTAASRRHVVYLVRATKAGRAWRELDRARSFAPDASFHLLTWESLHRMLQARAATGAATRPQRDLRDLLDRRGLRGFVGFRLGDLAGRELWDRLGVTRGSRVLEWVPRFRALATRAELRRWALLVSSRLEHAPTAPPGARARFARIGAGVDTSTVERLARWRARSGHGPTAAASRWGSMLPAGEVELVRRAATWRRSTAAPRSRWRGLADRTEAGLVERLAGRETWEAKS